MLESSVEGEAVRRARARGWWSIKIRQADKRGVPDRLFLRAGRCVWIEFKRPRGVSRRQQLLRILEIRAQGFEVYAIDSVERADAILG